MGTTIPVAGCGRDGDRFGGSDSTMPARPAYRPASGSFVALFPRAHHGCTHGSSRSAPYVCSLTQMLLQRSHTSSGMTPARIRRAKILQPRQ